MANYIHPSVTSRIIDNSVVFLTSTGLTNLFSVFVSEKGPDRELKYITSEDEFVFFYGEPNVRKYGQAAYNIINWLRSNGGVWCLRVTADGSMVNDVFTEPATYANTSFVVKSTRSNITIPTPAYTAGVKQETKLTINTPASGIQAQPPKDIQQIWKLNFKLKSGSSSDTLIDVGLLCGHNPPTTNTEIGAAPVQIAPSANLFTVADSFNQVLSNIKGAGGSATYYSGIVTSNTDGTVDLVITYTQPGAITGAPQFNPSILAPTKVPVVTAFGNVEVSSQVSQSGGQTYPSKLRISNTSKTFELVVDLLNGHSATELTGRISAAINTNAATLPFALKAPYVAGDKEIGLIYTNTGTPDSLVISDPDNSGASVRIQITTPGQEKVWLQGTRRYSWLKDADSSGYRYLNEDGTTGATFVPPVKTTTETVVLESLSLPLSDILLEKGKNYTNIKSLFSTLNTPTTSAVEARHYLFAVLPKGRGAFYNNIGYRLTPNFDLVGTYPDFVLYNFDVVELYRGSEISRERYIVALSPDAISTSRESLHIADVVNRYSKYVEIIFNEDAYEQLGEQISGVDPLNPDLVDLVSFRPLKEVKVQYVSQGSGKTVTVTLDAIEQQGVFTHRTNFTTGTSFLKGGKDGLLGNTGAAERVNVMALTDKLIANGYSGVTVPTVLDKRAVDVDVLLDANHSLVVKNAISDFASKSRMDCMAFLDTGFTSSAADALDVRKSLPATRYASIFTQDFVVTDSYTGRDEKFTATYFLAQKIANNDELNGISMNFVGPRRGGISGFKAMSWNPTPVQKDSLYKAQVNYCETDPSGTIFATQLTSQRQNSAMSNISMVRTIMRMQREAELIAASYRHEYGNSETFKQLQVNLGNALYKYVRSGAVKSLNVKVYASDYDLSQKLARVMISVQFTDIIERFEIDFVVSR